jgi:hypothetical protein
MPHAAINGVEVNFPPTDPTESKIYPFDFTLPLRAGETIVGVPVWSIHVFMNSIAQDPAPASRLIGSSGISGNIATQMVGNCLADVVYTLTATATTTAGEVLTAWAELPCNRIW